MYGVALVTGLWVNVCGFVKFICGWFCLLGLLVLLLGCGLALLFPHSASLVCLWLRFVLMFVLCMVFELCFLVCFGGCCLLVRSVVLIYSLWVCSILCCLVYLLLVMFVLVIRFFGDFGGFELLWLLFIVR